MEGLGKTLIRIFKFLFVSFLRAQFDLVFRSVCLSSWLPTVDGTDSSKRSSETTSSLFLASGGAPPRFLRGHHSRRPCLGHCCGCHQEGETSPAWQGHGKNRLLCPDGWADFLNFRGRGGGTLLLFSFFFLLMYCWCFYSYYQKAVSHFAQKARTVWRISRSWSISQGFIFQKQNGAGR